LSHQQTYVLPGSGYRHAILYAVADIGGQQVDFYCGQLISPVLGSEVPYEGAYGPLGLGTDGWESEQDLQATRAIAFIKAQSASSGHPAIIAGDWHSSIRAEDDTGTMLVSDLSPEVLRALDHAYGGAFDRAEPPGFTELCNWCPAPTNVYNGAQPPEDISPTFLLGFPSNATTLDTQWGTENVVPLTSTSDQTAPQGGVGPLSPYFGRLVRVTRPPQE
jgi:hypothetical protein